MTLPEIIALVEKSGIEGKVKDFLSSEGTAAATAVVKHLFAEHDPDLSGDADATQKQWAQAAFENFKHFLRVGGKDYGMPDFHGIGWGADVVYFDGQARTAIHELCNLATAHEIAQKKAGTP